MRERLGGNCDKVPCVRLQPSASTLLLGRERKSLTASALGKGAKSESNGRFGETRTAAWGITDIARWTTRPDEAAKSATKHRPTMEGRSNVSCSGTGLAERALCRPWAFQPELPLRSGDQSFDRTCRRFEWQHPLIQRARATLLLRALCRASRRAHY